MLPIVTKYYPIGSAFAKMKPEISHDHDFKLGHYPFRTITNPNCQGVLDGVVGSARNCLVRLAIPDAGGGDVAAGVGVGGLDKSRSVMGLRRRKELTNCCRFLDRAPAGGRI